MRKFFVDFRDGSKFAKDEEGTDLSSFKEVRDGAVEMLALIARDKLRYVEACKFVAMVRDEDGNTLYRATLTFQGERLK